MADDDRLHANAKKSSSFISEPATANIGQRMLEYRELSRRVSTFRVENGVTGTYR